MSKLKIFSGTTAADPTDISVRQSGAWQPVQRVWYRNSGTFTEVWPLSTSSGSGFDNTNNFNVQFIIARFSGLSNWTAMVADPYDYEEWGDEWPMASPIVAATTERYPPLGYDGPSRVGTNDSDSNEYGGNPGGSVIFPGLPFGLYTQTYDSLQYSPVLVILPGEVKAAVDYTQTYYSSGNTSRLNYDSAGNMRFVLFDRSGSAVSSAELTLEFYEYNTHNAIGYPLGYAGGETVSVYRTGVSPLAPIAATRTNTFTITSSAGATSFSAFDDALLNIYFNPSSLAIAVNQTFQGPRRVTVTQTG